MRYLKDEEFIRGNCPMTKEEVRALSISKMGLKEDSRVIDVGSGTGTITVQASIIAKDGFIYSIEKDEDAFNTTKININKFNLENVKQIKGNALSVLKEMKLKKIKVDSIFVGGSLGELEEIIDFSFELLKENGKLVLNFITLKNLNICLEKLKSLNKKPEIISANISRCKGESMMMISENPIFIIECNKGEK